MTSMIMRSLVALVGVAALCPAQSPPNAAALVMTLTKMDEAKSKEWLNRCEKTMKPDSWGGLAGAPFYLWRQNQLAVRGAK